MANASDVVPVKWFKMGKLVWTRGINNCVAEDLRFSAFVLRCVKRHIRNDWGDLGAEDKRENDYAVDRYLRILSAYNLPFKVRDFGSDKKIWVITEADRSATTVLWPSEY